MKQEETDEQRLMARALKDMRALYKKARVEAMKHFAGRLALPMGAFELKKLVESAAHHDWGRAAPPELGGKAHTRANPDAGRALVEVVECAVAVSERQLGRVGFIEFWLPRGDEQ